MVPAQRRPGLRAFRWLALAAVAGALLLALPQGRSLLRQARGYPAWRARAAQRLEAPPFSHLAASQVGYGPSMRKEFTSPRPFGGFRVLRLPGGEEALRGGPPVREQQSDLLAPPGRVWIGDFSALSMPGRYQVVLDDGLASHPFAVGPAVFDGALRAVQRAFYFQRAFTAVEPRHAEGPWVHAGDAHLAPPGVEKGWHDAGDLSLYSASTGSALFWLLQAQADFAPHDDDTNVPESGNGLPDLLDEARWGLSWLLSVQEPAGGFASSTCQERYGPYGTVRPETAAPYRAGEVGTLPTARAVGTLAYAAALFRGRDEPFARRCLKAALRGHAWLAARPGEHSEGRICPNLSQDGDARAGRDLRMYAAAGLLLATGEARFDQEFEAHLQLPGNDPSAYRFNVYAALLYLRAPAARPALQAELRGHLAERAREARADGAAHPFGWASRYFWGSIAAGLHRAAGFSVPACLAGGPGAGADCEQALASLHYAFGRNSLQHCYVSGLPGVTRGRSHAFHHWLAALRATPFAFPGLVAGGPTAEPVPSDVSYPHARPVPVWGYVGDPALPRDASTPVDGRYTDNDSWSTNELDVDWQGVAVYVLHFARSRARP